MSKKEQDNRCIKLIGGKCSEGKDESDATDLWDITNAIKKEIDSHSWVLEGRGSYAWDDDRYRDETRIVFEAVLKLVENVQHPAQKRFHKVMDGTKSAKV